MAEALGLVTSEIKYRMDLIGVQEVRWKVVLIILYFMGKVMLTINWELGFLFIGKLGQQ